MEPIQILELIKEDIRDKFDGEPLMMRTMNLVITEYKARSERLHKPVFMQAACQHEIVDARNQVITSGYLCVKCNAVFKAAAVADGAAGKNG